MRGPIDANPPEVELLLAAERDLVPEPDRIRDAAVARARAALPASTDGPRTLRTSTVRRSRVGLPAAAAVLLFAVCAAAFVTGYRADKEKSPKPAAAPSPAGTTLGPAAPTSASTPSPALAPGPPVHEPQPTRARPPAPKKAASSDEADLLELRVLRPAQQAEWRGDFAAALAAIAEHQRRFPSGQLAEEREGLRVRALLGLGRVDEAQSAGAAFRRRFPHSALLLRLDAMLEKHQ